MAGSPPDIDGLDVADLKELILRLLEENAHLRAEVAALREEIARLKGLKGPPKIRPSGMEKKADHRRAVKERRTQARRGKKRDRVRIDERQVVSVEVPPGSRLKGYEDFVVQDLVVRPHTVLYRRERWLTADGRTIVAPLPAGISGHFGPSLRRFVLSQYHQGQTTMERLTTLLVDLGVDISKRQVVRLLNEKLDAFKEEDAAVLHTGMEPARWLAVDDTGARHGAKNAVCTCVSNDLFTWFSTTFSKSRLNFLEILRAGHGDYVVNEAALAYMRERQLSGPMISLLAGHERRRFETPEAWTAHLEGLGITARGHHPDPARIATEGALWGCIVDHGLLADTVILSDDAGQFNVGLHALCWVHAERLVHKLDAFSEWQRKVKERIKRRIWWLYADIKAFCRDPTARRRRELRARFKRLFTTRTGFATLDRLLERQYANRDELLLALNRPEVPLHTNGVENDARCHVTRRKVSAGTYSQDGRESRDALLGLMKTCRKLGVSFWDYLGNRLAVPGAPTVPPLPEIIRQKAAMQT